MEIGSTAIPLASHTGGDAAVRLRIDQERGSSSIPTGNSLNQVLRPLAFALGASLVCTPEVCAARMHPYFGTNPQVSSMRPRSISGNTVVFSKAVSVDHRLMSASAPDQAKATIAALSLTKSQLAGVLRVSRPTVYELLSGKELSAKNGKRLHDIIRLLVKAGVSVENPLNARFVRHALDGTIPALIDLFCAEDLDETLIDHVIRQAKTLGQESESQRGKREDRLRSLGYSDASPERRRDNLNHLVASLEWPKR